MNSTFVIQAAASIIATYAIHSTLLLLVAWLFSRMVVKHAAVRERLWKWSTVIPLFSTAFVLCCNQSQPIWEWRSDFAANRVVAGVETCSNSSESAPVRVLSAIDEAVDLVEPEAIAEFDTDNGLLLSDFTIESSGVSSPDAYEPLEAAIAYVDSESEEDWAVQIVPGKAIARPRSLTANSQSGVAQSLAPPVLKVKGNQSAATTTSSSVGDGPATTEGVTQFDANQVVPPNAVSLVCLLIVSIAGGFAVLGMIRFAMSQIRIGSVLGRGQTMTEGQAFKLLTQLLADRDIKQPVRLLSNDDVSEPAATGVLRWTIVLPSGLPSRLSDCELSALLCHELGHLVRRDTVWLLFGHWVTAVLPWQLLNFVAIQKWHQSAELECDEWALSSNVEALTLARVLTNVAEWKTSNRLGVGLPATAPPLSLRIEALLNRSNGGRRSRSKLQQLLFATMLLGTLCGVSAFGPRMTWASLENIRSLDSPSDNLPPRLALAESEELSELRSEFQALSADLQLALELLAEQETDPVIDRTVDKITNRLEQIQANIHQEGFAP